MGHHVQQLHHIHLAAAATTASQDAATATRKLASSTDVRLQVLCWVLSSVYGSRFEDCSDQLAVQQLIVQHMDVPQSELEASDAVTLQDNVPGTLRIGAVYLTRGELSVICVGVGVGVCMHLCSLQSVFMFLAACYVSARGWLHLCCNSRHDFLFECCKRRWGNPPAHLVAPGKGLPTLLIVAYHRKILMLCLWCCRAASRC